MENIDFIHAQRFFGLGRNLSGLRLNGFSGYFMVRVESFTRNPATINDVEHFSHASDCAYQMSFTLASQANIEFFVTSQ